MSTRTLSMQVKTQKFSQLRKLEIVPMNLKGKYWEEIRLEEELRFSKHQNKLSQCRNNRLSNPR
jgi:hypothetical protein